MRGRAFDQKPKDIREVNQIEQEKEQQRRREEEENRKNKGKQGN